ncbi:hypothetical protein [Moritella sp. F3]|uniref:hypothetical protein n=1 Tax=Moritella sp. F3 TaxID=2718882 RepID=UPI001A334B27|nr:hypothetical protein [Moritella sp. F3]GIC77205.1 hypothetical protein FMO001_19320 [Moritella sp. F1]GIC82324.1 hypothetical protein FMO003_26050 [Moritella sp. F3]
MNALLKPLVHQSKLLNEPIVPTPELIKEFNISAKTSIARSKPSAPLKQLLADGLITGSVLNYGKGRANKDSEAIIDATGRCIDYDFCYAPFPELLGTEYDTIYCGYVVNTLPPGGAREHVWQQMANATKGFCYVAARSNTDRGIKGIPHEDGVRTSISTFQRGYCKNELMSEALSYFKHVVELKTKGAYRMVQCSHSPFDEAQ